ncbi:SseB family protein [Aurantivibrio infirmus]
MIEIFYSENKIERLLIEAQNKEIDFGFFLEEFLKSDVVVPSEDGVLPDGYGIAPLVFNKVSIQMLGAFTSLSRASIYKAQAPYCLSIKGIELLKRMPPNTGLVVNPSYSVGFEIPPNGIEKILRDFQS